MFRFGLVPWAINPLPAIDLSQPNLWFVDWRLAAIKNNPDLCRRVLVAPHIEAQPIADSPMRDGCGWVNGVRMSTAGGVRAGFDKLTCEAAVALALWLKHDLQDLAQEHFAQRVVAVQSFGTFSCRNIVGNPLWKAWRSEHATANAVDIGGFTLADGRRISVKASLARQRDRGALPASGARERLPLLPRRIEPRLQCCTPRPLPLRPRAAVALQVMGAEWGRAGPQPKGRPRNSDLCQ